MLCKARNVVSYYLYENSIDWFTRYDEKTLIWLSYDDDKQL